MLNKHRHLLVVALSLSMAILLSGCQQAADSSSAEQSPGQKEQDLEQLLSNNAEEVAKLVTYECCSHVVAKKSDTGWWTLKDRETWIEYDATCSYGIDATKVRTSIEERDGEKVIVVEMPHATVVENPGIDSESIGPAIERKGLLAFGDLSVDEKNEIITQAQEEFESEARNNAAMITRAESQAMKLLTEYAENASEVVGLDYKVIVEFIEQE